MADVVIQWIYIWPKDLGHAPAFRLILKRSMVHRGEVRGRLNSWSKANGKRDRALLLFEYHFLNILTKVSKDVQPLVFWGFHGIQVVTLSPFTSDPSVYFTQHEEMKFVWEPPEGESCQQTATSSLLSVNTLPLTLENEGIRPDWKEEIED